MLPSTLLLFIVCAPLPTIASVYDLITCFPSRNFKADDFQTDLLSHTCPLHEIANADNEQLFIEFLEKNIGLDKKKDGVSIVMYCYKKNKKSFVNLLLNSKKINLDEEIDEITGLPLLHRAAWYLDKPMIESLLAHNASVHIEIENHQTPALFIRKNFPVYEEFGLMEEAYDCFTLLLNTWLRLKKDSKNNEFYWELPDQKAFDTAHEKSLQKKQNRKDWKIYRKITKTKEALKLKKGLP